MVGSECKLLWQARIISLTPGTLFLHLSVSCVTVNIEFCWKDCLYGVLEIQAAVFNQTEIVFALMDHGARLDCKNSQGKWSQHLLNYSSSRVCFRAFGPVEKWLALPMFTGYNAFEICTWFSLSLSLSYTRDVVHPVY